MDQVIIVYGYREMDDYAKGHPFPSSRRCFVATYRLLKDNRGTYSLMATLMVGDALVYQRTMTDVPRPDVGAAIRNMAESVETERAGRRLTGDAPGVPAGVL